MNTNPAPSQQDNDPTSTIASKSDPEQLDLPSSADSASIHEVAALKPTSPRGVCIIAITMSAQMIDNMFSVTIALPTIANDLGIRREQYLWILSAYALTFGGFLLLFSSLSDRHSTPRTIFITGMLLLTISSLGCSFSPSLIPLIVCRALQGLGAAATVPSAIGTLGNVFRGEDVTMGMAWYGAGGSVGWVVGVVFGGVTAGTIGWRYIFRILSPVTGVLAITAWFLFPNPPASHTQDKPARRRLPLPVQKEALTRERVNLRGWCARFLDLDVGGSVLGCSAAVLLVFGLSSSEIYGWGSAIVIGPLVASVVALGLFIIVESKVSNPIMPLWLWKQPGFSATWLTGLFFHAWWGPFVMYLILLAQDVLGLSALQTGIRLIPFGGFGFIVTVSVGIFLRWVNVKTLVVSGLLVGMISNVPMGIISPSSNFWASVFVSALLGAFACSVVYNTLAIALVASVPDGAKSLAGGLITTAFQIGNSIGLAICSIPQDVVYKRHHPRTDTPQDLQHAAEMNALTKSLTAGLWTSLALAGVGVLFALVGIKRGVRPNRAVVVKEEEVRAETVEEKV